MLELKRINIRYIQLHDDDVRACIREAAVEHSCACTACSHAMLTNTARTCTYMYSACVVHQGAFHVLVFRDRPLLISVLASCIIASFSFLFLFACSAGRLKRTMTHAAPAAQELLRGLRVVSFNFSDTYWVRQG